MKMNKCKKPSPNSIENFILLLKSISSFYKLVNNVTDYYKFREVPFILLLSSFTIIRYRAYFKILFLRFFATKKTKEITDFKDNYIDPCRFEKKNSVKPLISFLFDIDNCDLKDLTKIGVFTKNIQDREFDKLGNNLVKREYYSAFNLKTIPYYDTHLDDLFNSLHKDSINKLPLLSSFSNHLVTYFLNMHLGKPTCDHKRPTAVFDYFSDTIDNF